LPPGWTFGSANVRNGWSQFALDSDRVGSQALVVRLTATCDTSGAVRLGSDPSGVQRYERPDPGSPTGGATAYTVFSGGCVTIRFDPAGTAPAGLADEATSVVGFTTRHSLAQTLDARSNGRLQLDPP
jgi:hypothetical protein